MFRVVVFVIAAGGLVEAQFLTSRVRVRNNHNKIQTLNSLSLTTARLLV